MIAVTLKIDSLFDTFLTKELIATIHPLFKVQGFKQGAQFIKKIVASELPLRIRRDVFE
jgi:hypothetical protein